MAKTYITDISDYLNDIGLLKRDMPARSLCRNRPTGTKRMATNDLLRSGCLPGAYSRV